MSDIVHKRSDGRLPVMEVFGPTIQGEGSVAGQKSHFIRFGGCDYRCSWCDSMHAVDPKIVHDEAKWMTQNEAANAIRRLPIARMVTITGGNPCIWDLSDLVNSLNTDHLIAVETQGSKWQEWLTDCDYVTVSPKPPSSKMDNRIDWDMLDKYVDILHTSQTSEAILSFKVVIFSQEDFNWSKFLHAKYPDIPFYVSAGTPIHKWPHANWHIEDVLGSYRRLADMILKDPEMFDVIALPQLHVLLWPGQDKGK